MKISTKILALLMSFIMLCSAAVLTSCDSSTPEMPDDTTPADGAADTTPVVEETTPEPAPESADLVMVKDGECFVQVVRSDDAATGSAKASCASDVHKALKSITSTNPKITTDWIKKGQDYDHDSVEILVGWTEYSESQQTFDELSYGEYVIKVVGNKLVIAAFSDAVLVEACDKAISLLKQLSDGGNLVIPADTYIHKVSDQMLNLLPAYENADFNCTYSCGGSAQLLVVDNTDLDEYNAYIAKLEAAGWKNYTTNSISGNRFDTYNTDKYTINMGFYDYEDAARIIIEPLAKPVGLKEDNVYQKVTTPQITMLGLEYTNKNSGEQVANGQSMLVRLADGRFIIIDGGFNDNAGAKSGDLLIKELKEQSKDYLKSGEKITIAAWIVTHAHGDHYGMIIEQYAKFKSMNVEMFMVNFLSEAERLAAINSPTYGKNWSATEGNTWTKLISAAKNIGADVQYVHVGQVFYMADVKLDILYTIESFAPKTCNALNTSSLTIKFTFDSGDTFLMTGDTTGNGMEIAAKTFKDYIKCDMLQVAHHGGTTWGNDAGMIYAYKAVAPEVLLWPRGMSTFDSSRSKNYNKVLFSPAEGGSNENFKELFVSGAEGEKIIVPIPYTVGTAQVTRNN